MVVVAMRLLISCLCCVGACVDVVAQRTWSAARFSTTWRCCDGAVATRQSSVEMIVVPPAPLSLLPLFAPTIADFLLFSSVRGGEQLSRSTYFTEDTNRATLPFVLATTGGATITRSLIRRRQALGR